MADQPHHHHRHRNNNNDHQPHQMAGNPPPDEPRPQAADPSDQPKQPIEQQQQQASPASEDMLDCKWQGCADTFSNPESLYDHICDRHVGRKSTNNLCLTCQWNGCRTTTVKRDHITSHIRVHVPLKPHKCDLCNKSFKRPQDLKKHVKTHADDSMLNRTMEDAAVANGLNLLRHPMLKGPAGYYDHMRQGGATAAPGFVPALGYYQPAGNPAGYQPMYYQHGGHPGGGMGPPRPEYMNHHLQQLNHSGHGLHSHHPGAGSHERKRTLDVVSDFLGNVKRRHIDTMSYDQISRSLIPLHDGGAASALLPVQPVEYHYSQHQPQAQHHAADMHHAPPAHHHHHHQQHHQISHHGGPSPLTQHHILPGELESGRTRKELLDLNGLLEQMRTTIYENGPPHPAHGGSHYHAQNYTHSASAIPVAGTAADPYGGIGHQPSPQASSSSMSSIGETAAVSPPTSTVSYVSASARSPTPSSASTRSPRSRHGSAPLYPHISAASMSMSASSSSSSSIYSAQSPPATLGGRGSIQDSDQRRMYSGSMLQRARVGVGPPQLRPLAVVAGAAKSSVMEAPAATTNKIEDGRGSPTPTLTPTAAATPGVTTPAAAVGSVGSPSSESDASDYTREAEERYDHWLGDMRLIESLHNYVRDQLARIDLETEGVVVAAAAPTGAGSTGGGGSGGGSGHVEAGLRVRSSPVPPSPLPPLYPKLRVT